MRHAPGSARVENVGQALLYKLKRLGADYFFATPGSEFGSIIDGFEQFRRDGIDAPTPVTAPHENLAVSMAYGAYLVTGKAQAVMAHVTVGIANSLLGLMNASRMNVPIVYLAGRTPIRESGGRGSRDRFVHWAQESRDQAEMLREYVKWDYELRSAEMLEPVLERAWAIAMSEPRGPVCLSLPRELLLAPHAGDLSDEPKVRPATAPRPDDAALRRVASLLATAERPLIVTSRSGADLACVDLLRAVSERFSVAVSTPHAHYVSFSAAHPFYLGDRPERLLSEVDLVLVLDTDVPWCPLDDGPAAGATVISVGPDPLWAAIPVRSHRADIAIQSSVRSFLEDLLASAPRLDQARVGSRAAWVSSKRKPVAKPAAPGLRSADVAWALGHCIDDDTIVVNELSLPAEGLALHVPGSYYRAGSASGLGWALGCGLGIKLASPSKKVVTVVGDGAYYLANPLAAHWIEAAYRLPTLTVVLNNRSMGSILQAVHDFYPPPAGGAGEPLPLTSLEPALPFHAVMNAMGGYGEAVEHADELGAALLRCQAAVSGGKAAVLNVLLSTAYG